MVIGMQQPYDQAYEAHKVLQTNGEVFVTHDLGCCYSYGDEYIQWNHWYVFNDMETLNHDDVWSYLWLYGYWDVDGARAHICSLIC